MWDRAILWSVDRTQQDDPALAACCVPDAVVCIHDHQDTIEKDDDDIANLNTVNETLMMLWQDEAALAGARGM